MQSGEALPLLRELMQQLAFACSLASCQQSLVNKLPQQLAAAASRVSAMPLDQKINLQHIAQVIDYHLINTGSNRIFAAKPTQEEPFTSLFDSESESEEEDAELNAAFEQYEAHMPTSTQSQTSQSHTTRSQLIEPQPFQPQPVSNKGPAPAGKASVPASKQAQPAAGTAVAAANSNKPGSLSDALRTTPSVAVNDGDQRAANKRLQLRNKLKKAREVAGAQTAKAEAEAGPSMRSASEKELQQLENTVQPYEDAVETAPKPSKKVLKRERRRAAAAAAAVAAADVFQQPDVADSHHDSSGRPSTAEGTSSSSAASLVSSPVRTGGSAQQPDTGPSSSRETAEARPSNIVAAYDSSQAELFAEAKSSHLSGGNTAQASSKPKVPDSVPEAALTDSKLAANGLESSCTQTSQKPAIGKQELDAGPKSPMTAPNQKADASDDGNKPQLAAAQVTDATAAGSSAASSNQASSRGDQHRTNAVEHQAGSTIANDTKAQADQPESIPHQKPEQSASEGTAVAPAAHPPAAIAAHRPAAKKVVLRASAAPYTPLSSKAVLADKGKAVAPAAAAAVNPATTSTAENKGKKVVSGQGVHSYVCEIKLICRSLRHLCCYSQVS